MHISGSNRFTRPLAMAVALTMTVSLALGVGAIATASAHPSAQPSAQQDALRAPVAHNKQGTLKSRIVGTTASGREVTGTFTPLKFVRSGDQARVRGLVSGVVHNARGATTTFATMRTFKVATINGIRPGAGTGAAARGLECGILNLVLGPLDLDLLGLQVHLDRVVLDIVAATGAHNLLGNLLCAVTGLLDGVAIIGRLIDLLNQILDLFMLGL